MTGIFERLRSPTRTGSRALCGTAPTHFRDAGSHHHQDIKGEASVPFMSWASPAFGLPQSGSYWVKSRSEG